MQEDFYVGAWLVQPSLGRVSLEGRTVQVRPKVMDVLVYLAGSHGRVISKDTLLNDVWGTEAISESALTRTIAELRSALGDDPEQPLFLETIPKRGYRLIAPVSAVAEAQEGRSRRRRVAMLLLTASGVLISAAMALVIFKMAPSEATGVPLVRPLTTWPGEEGQPCFSPDGKRLAFVWNGGTDDNFDIYVKRIGDDSLARLTTDGQPDRSPAWSPDGRAIAFVRASNSGAALLLVPASGGTERLVANLRRISVPVRLRILDWSADGRALLVVDQDSPGKPFQIVRISIDTGERTQLTSPPAHSYGDLHPAVSPDGRTLAFARSLAPGPSDIHLVPIGGGEPRRLTFDDNIITGLTWSEDGASIVFSSERGAMAGTGSLWKIHVDPMRHTEPEQLPGIGQRAAVPVIAKQGRLLAYQEYFQDTNLWRLATTGKGPAEPIVSSTREENFPDYSSDGGRIAFASNRSGNWETWIAAADGSSPRQLTAYAAAPAWNSRWSPNGRLLAFNHSPQGNADIYTITPEGSAVRRLTSEPSSEQNPAWSRDGRWIYFSSNRSGVFQIWKMSLGSPSQLEQITYAGGTNPRESTDGARLFYVRREGSSLEIWSTGVNGGTETRVVGPIRSLSGWAPGSDGIYFIQPAGPIAFYRFATGVTTPIVELPRESSPYNPGMTLSPDGKWLLYARMDRSGADIMLVDNYQ